MKKVFSNEVDLDIALAAWEHSAYTQEMTIGARAEYDYAKTVIMHNPKDELFLGFVHPAAALFEKNFHANQASNEHAHYQDLIRRTGAQVLTVREMLLAGTLTAEGNIIEGKPLNDLRDFASRYLKYNTANLSTLEAAEQVDYLHHVLSELHPYDLVKIILLQPEIVLKKTSGNTFLTADYLLNPVMNLYFSRDQIITTAKGVVVGKLNSDQRAIESQIVEFCLPKIGVKPIHKISTKNAYLEGGDFIPSGDYALIGCGIRTTQEAIDELMAADAWGSKYVVVVHDKWQNQVQMHLDTYFNIIDKDLACLAERRLNAKADDCLYLTVDVYEKKDGKYEQIIFGASFVKYLREEMKMTILPVNHEDQVNYGTNFLTMAPREIIAVAGQSDEYIKTFEAAGVHITWVDYTNLKCGYGAAHCSTQVIERTLTR